MSVDIGPKLGLLINADIGEDYVDRFREFLQAIDALLLPNVINSTTTSPPSSPSNGDAYLLIGTPSGAWTGYQNCIAVWSTEITESESNTKVPGWNFYTPNAGWLVWVSAVSAFYVFNAGTWQAYNYSPTQVSIAPSGPGNFQVAHGLGTTPSAVTLEMTSGGQVWFQSTRYDATYIYLVASDAGLTGYAKVWL